MQMSDKVYDVLKFIAQIILPIAAAIIFALGDIWGVIPYSEEIVGTIVLIDAVLGSVLGISTMQYEKKSSN